MLTAHQPSAPRHELHGRTRRVRSVLCVKLIAYCSLLARRTYDFRGTVGRLDFSTVCLNRRNRFSKKKKYKCSVSLVWRDTHSPPPTRPHGRQRTATRTRAQYVSGMHMCAVCVPTLHPLAGWQHAGRAACVCSCRGRVAVVAAQRCRGLLSLLAPSLLPPPPDPPERRHRAPVCHASCASAPPCV